MLIPVQNIPFADTVAPSLRVFCLNQFRLHASPFNSSVGITRISSLAQHERGHACHTFKVDPIRTYLLISG